MTAAVPPSISTHARPADATVRRGFGPRVRRLHARIGKAHHQAEGMAFSRALLEGQATPRQLAALIRSLVPAYALIESRGPALARSLGAGSMPWDSLSRATALRHDVAILAALGPTAPSAAAQAWLDQLERLSQEAPQRFMAHVYVRYGGDLSGGQQLAEKARIILAEHNLPSLEFWQFPRPVAELKQGLHDAFEALRLSADQEEELLQEAETAFLATHRLLAELAEVR
jgi:heme oxygenase